MPRGAVEAGDGAAEAGRPGLAARGENEEEGPDELGEDAARSHVLPAADPGRRMLGCAVQSQSPVCVQCAPQSTASSVYVSRVRVARVYL